MLDNLREQASATPFPEEDEFSYVEDMPARRRKSGSFLGLSPRQRFILALMLLMAVCTLGIMFLLIMGKLVPSFLF